jgi:hypothetical protein
MPLKNSFMIRNMKPKNNRTKDKRVQNDLLEWILAIEFDINQ